MRTAATLILAKFLGQTLTPEVLARLLAEFPADAAPLDLQALPVAECGRMTFQAERLRDIRPELHELHEQHWLETEGYQQGIELDGDYEALVADEQCGRLVQLTARDGGRLVGNTRMYLARSRHTRRRIATEDTIYLSPDYRRGRNALRFTEFMESCMRALGAQDIYLDDKVGNPAAGRVLGFMGYRHIANRRFKNLEETNVRT